MRNLLFFIHHAVVHLNRERQRTLFVLFCIAAGVASVVSLRTLGLMVTDALTRDLQASNRGDIAINVPSQIEESNDQHSSEIDETLFQIRGDTGQIVGLSRALIYAGAPSMVSSLWSVNDELTRVLMERFYTHLRAGMSKAGALRQAQMEMIASEEYAHPYYWAAFGLTGDPGERELPEPIPTMTAVLTATPVPAPTSTPVQVVQAMATPAPMPEEPGRGLCGAAMLPLVALAVLSVQRRNE